MNRIIGLIALLLIVSCNKEVKDYVTLKGKLKSANGENIVIKSRNYTKTITVNKDGTFLDTLKVNDGLHLILNGNDRFSLFLKNGYDLDMQLKGETFAEGVDFTGNGAETNNYMSKLYEFYSSELGNPKTYFSLDEEAYKAKIKEANDLLNTYKGDASKLDTLVLQMDESNKSRFFQYVEKNYKKERDNLVKFAPGKTSPKFTNYENYKGGKTSLSDLKGKYVYIDIWATWCGPCKAEIPSLKALEKEFHGKDIEFVSISVDNIDGRRGSRDSWLKMVKEQNLGGTQLFADNDFSSQFIQDYAIQSIPRFILLDPKGNIVDANAARPSNPSLKKQLMNLGL